MTSPVGRLSSTPGGLPSAPGGLSSAPGGLPLTLLKRVPYDEGVLQLFAKNQLKAIAVAHYHLNAIIYTLYRALDDLNVPSAKFLIEGINVRNKYICIGAHTLSH